MKERYEEYFAFMRQLGGVLEQLTAIANEKNAAVRRDDLMTVNDCMKREQAIALSLRAMDRKREKMLEEMGLRDVRLSALADHCPPEVRLQARDAAEKLKNQYAVFRSAADSARTTMEMNLHEIEKIIAAREESGAALPLDRGTFADIRA